MKKFLIIVCAGDNSYHKKWFNSDIYDIYTIYFGNDESVAGKYEKKSDFFLRMKGPKWQLIRYVLKNFEWRRYKYIWMPDDYLDITKKKVEDFLNISDKLNLNVSQPSLRVPDATVKEQIEIIADWKKMQKEAELQGKYAGWFSYYKKNTNKITENIREYISYKILMQEHPTRKKAVRYTNFVEIMCPLLKNFVLKKMFKLMDNDIVQSGFYLDTIWSHMVRYKRVAVIDYISVIHTRPVGTFTKRKTGNYKVITIDPKKEVMIQKKRYRKKIPKHYVKTLRTVFLNDKKKDEINLRKKSRKKSRKKRRS